MRETSLTAAGFGGGRHSVAAPAIPDHCHSLLTPVAWIVRFLCLFFELGGIERICNLQQGKVRCGGEEGIESAHSTSPAEGKRVATSISNAG
jgi:hypothetical protein